MWPLPSPLLMLAGSFVAASVGFGSGWAINGWRIDAAQANQARSQAEADRMARQAAQSRVIGVDDAHQTRLRAAHVAADRLRSELDGLRRQIAAAQPSTSAACAGVSARAARAEQLLGSCASRYSEVARDAQLYADQLRGWQQLFGPED